MPSAWNPRSSIPWLLKGKPGAVFGWMLLILRLEGRVALHPGGPIRSLTLMITGSVLDILIYVFDRYMLDEVPEVPEREHLARHLEHAGFAQANVERALDWLADLACERDRLNVIALDEAASGAAVRIFSDGELARLSTECRGYLLTLERLAILSPRQREIVIDRMLALDVDEFDIEQLKWVVLMVLSSQPGQEVAFQRLEDLVADASGAAH